MNRNHTRHTVYVQIPITDNFSYSLFAQGFLSEIPHESKKKDSLVFKFTGGSVFFFFFSFANLLSIYFASDLLYV